jgi:hypothetical protein
MERGEITTNDIGTNTINPQLGLFNLQQKKKPYDVKIKNFNRNEPKIKQNVKYSAKQNFRKYKSNIEPNLRSKIMIDEEDDMVNKIKKAFGIETTSKRNFTQTETYPLSSQGLGLIEPRLADDDEEVNRYADIFSNISRRGMLQMSRNKMTDEEVEEWAAQEFKNLGLGLSLSDVERIQKKIEAKRASETQEKREDRERRDQDEFNKLIEEETKKNDESLSEDAFGDLTKDDMDEVLAAPVELFKPPEGEVGEDVLLADEGEAGDEEDDDAEVEAADIEEEPASPVSRGATTASMITTEAAREAALTATGEFRSTPGRKPSTDPDKVAKRAEKIDREEKKLKAEAKAKAEAEAAAEEAAKPKAKTSKSSKS